MSFINILDLASIFGVAMIPSKHPKIVWDHFFKHWITPLGVQRRLIYDQGGEFEREFGQELEDLGCEPNAVCERHGWIWKTHARRMQDEFSVKFVPEQLHGVTWRNSAIDDSGYSPAQWVLGRGLRLPYTLLDQTGRLFLHERVTRDRAFSERIAMMSAAQRSITSLRYDRAWKGKARVGCTLAWPCNNNWSATRVAVVGTQNNDSKMQQRSRSTRNSVRTVATWSDA